MKVSVYDPFVNEKEISSYGGKKIDNFYEAIKVMDYVSIHIPLTEKIKKLNQYESFNHDEKKLNNN